LMPESRAEGLRLVSRDSAHTCHHPCIGRSRQELQIIRSRSSSWTESG
jgi:hypothetical protein